MASGVVWTLLDRFSAVTTISSRPAFALASESDGSAVDARRLPSPPSNVPRQLIDRNISLRVNRISIPLPAPVALSALLFSHFLSLIDVAGRRFSATRIASSHLLENGAQRQLRICQNILRHGFPGGDEPSSRLHLGSRVHSENRLHASASMLKG